MRTTPVRSITMTKRFISGVDHPASDPNPVVVNVSTTIWRDSRNVLGRSSNVVIPYW